MGTKLYKASGLQPATLLERDSCIPLFRILVSPPLFSIRTPFKTFYTVPFTQLLAVNRPSSSSTLTSPTQSLWRNLFAVTNYNHLNFDATNQTNIVARKVGILGISMEANKLCKSVFLDVSQSKKLSCTTLLHSSWFSNCSRLWSHLLKKSLMQNFIFCAVKIDRKTFFKDYQ